MATWKIDVAHSEIQFKIRHLMITNVTGSFTQFDATLDATKEDFTDGKISFTADVNSITTNNEQRDGHLKSDDFFSAEKYPQISFASTAIKHKGGDDYILEGELTIRDQKHPISLDVEFGGIQVDPWGQTKAGFELKGKISRKEFGLTWSATTEAGGVVVGDDVKLQLNVQMIKQA
ncbi:polyisoprenoid-binding protein YceI [Chitinophaga skermanii]|uniref:Polyisoprenoid-binding protein YceI n=1 Tax=Chitinophaga skermanii TaxID=331697 RepID=A0A327QHW5_9BACT|nr:YceI family protein [Chitinophaga skermanii]RAJ04000.1 polyisoprenoid-binding protein YceI [Chitinophaga skermanii]